MCGIIYKEGDKVELYSTFNIHTKIGLLAAPRGIRKTLGNTIATVIKIKYENFNNPMWNKVKPGYVRSNAFIEGNRTFNIKRNFYIAVGINPNPSNLGFAVLTVNVLKLKPFMEKSQFDTLCLSISGNHRFPILFDNEALASSFLNDPSLKEDFLRSSSQIATEFLI